MSGVSIPNIPVEATQVPQASSSESSTPTSSLSDQLVKQVLQNIVPFQGDMSQVVQNRPQVILPRPTLPGSAQAGDPNRGIIQNPQTGAGRQRNDIMNLFHTVGQVATQGLNLKRQKEENELMADLAIIEAAASNPNDPHNKAILNTIAGDSKKVKRLQKALGYNPLSGETPPSETRTLQKYGAQSTQKKQSAQQLQQAIQQRLGPQASQQQDAMGNLLNRAPNVLQMNPIVAVQGELIKAGILPKADSSLQALTSLTKDVMTNEAKYAELKNKIEISNNQILAKYLESIDAAKAKLDLEKIRQEGATERSKIRARATTTAASIAAGSRVESAKVRGSSTLERYKATHTNEESKLLDKAVKNIDQDIKNLDVQITTARNLHGDNSKEVEKLIEEQLTKKTLKTVLEQRESNPIENIESTKKLGTEKSNLVSNINTSYNKFTPGKLYAEGARVIKGTSIYEAIRQTSVDPEDKTYLKKRMSTGWKKIDIENGGTQELDNKDKIF